MADPHPPTASTCAACGLAIPEHSGPGRRRRYCNATCRSADRRRRQRQDPNHVNPMLLPSPSHDNIDVGRDAGEILMPLDLARKTIAEMAGMLTTHNPEAAFKVVVQATELNRIVHTILQEAVGQARAAGGTWEQIGSVLGISRQGAFQRFGPKAPSRYDEVPDGVSVPDAVDRVSHIIAWLTEGQWDKVRDEFADEMRGRLNQAQLAMGWEHTVAMIGQIDRIGDPFVHAIREYTGVDVPLYFEAGERLCRIILDSSGAVVGLFLRPMPT